MKRYFAVVDRRSKSGYALDYYPEEREAYRRGEGKGIIGDFATAEQAEQAIHAFLQRNYGTHPRN